MNRLRIAALIAAGMALGGSARAQVSITAEVDKNVVALNDQVALTVTISGPASSLPQPQLPQLPDFSVYSSNTSQSFSFVNGQVSSSNQYMYVLVPHRPGQGTIPPISLTYNGQTVRTAPIQIEVSPAGAGAASTPQAAAQAPPGKVAQPQAAAQPDLFVTADVDKRRAYVNQQVLLTVKFYTAVSLLGNPQYKAPSTSGFLTEDLPPERHGTVVLHGRNYYFSEIKTALFPTQAGRLTIGAATVAAEVERQAALDPFSSGFVEQFFNQGLSQAEERDLRSQPIIVDVLPLPAQGKTAQFSGAVGRFSLTDSTDRSSAKVGDAVTLSVTIKGEGNLKAIAAPALPPMPDFRSYDTVGATSLDKSGGVVAGSKVFKTVLVPRVSGRLSIPPMTFDYFDPSRRAYVRARTAPIGLSVAPGEAGGGGINFAQTGAAAPAPGLAEVSQDIRYLHTAADRSPVDAFLAALAAARGLNVLPFLVFGASLGSSQYERLRNLDPRRRRRRAALKSALKRVEQAQTQAQQRQAAALMSEALNHYLADKLDVPALGLTLKRALESLRQERPALPEELAGRLREVWQDLDALQFAPPGPDGAAAGGQDAERLRGLLASLDKEIGP